MKVLAGRSLQRNGKEQLQPDAVSSEVDVTACIYHGDLLGFRSTSICDVDPSRPVRLE
jgi:hypothetical protein